jgi:hypothetical protein
MIEYLFIGLGFYLGCATCRAAKFKDASIFSILKGLICGVVFWPIIIPILTFITEEEAGG